MLALLSASALLGSASAYGPFSELAVHHTADRAVMAEAARPSEDARAAYAAISGREEPSLRGRELLTETIYAVTAPTCDDMTTACTESIELQTGWCYTLNVTSFIAEFFDDDDTSFTFDDDMWDELFDISLKITNADSDGKYYGVSFASDDCNDGTTSSVEAITLDSCVLNDDDDDFDDDDESEAYITYTTDMSGYAACTTTSLAIQSFVHDDSADDDTFNEANIELNTSGAGGLAPGLALGLAAGVLSLLL